MHLYVCSSLTFLIKLKSDVFIKSPNFLNRTNDFGNWTKLDAFMWFRMKLRTSRILGFVVGVERASNSSVSIIWAILGKLGTPLV